MKKSSTAAARQAPPEPPGDTWELRLYVAGQSPKSVAAFANLKKLCEEHLAGKYRIEVIDLIQKPQLAAGDQIVAIPTLVRKLPAPLRKIVGDLAPRRLGFVEGEVAPAPSREAGRAGSPTPPAAPPEVVAGASVLRDVDLRRRFLEVAARYLERSKGGTHA